MSVSLSVYVSLSVCCESVCMSVSCESVGVSLTLSVYICEFVCL